MIDIAILSIPVEGNNLVSAELFREPKSILAVPDPRTRQRKLCWFGRSCADASDPGQPDDRDERWKQHPLDVQFIAGIREHGVLQPITAIRTDGVELRDGQRRAHAARQVDLATIPVSVVFESLPSGRWPRVMSSARSQAVDIPAFKPAHSSAARSNYGVHMAIPPIPAVLAPQEAEAQDR